MKIALIGDLHADPNHDSDLSRFSDCGRFIAQEDCDIVVQIGDWLDMPSITEHRSRLELEGDRVDRDLQVGNDSLAAFMRPFKRRKKKLPEFHFFEGNHEYRLERARKADPQRFTHSLNDFKLSSFGWHIHHYGRFHNICGFDISHCIMGKAGKAITLGPTFVKRGSSMVVGHTHEFQHLTQVRSWGYTHGIDVGCLTKKGYSEAEDWSAPNAAGTWRGIHILEGADRGDARVFRHIRAEEFTEG